MVTLLVGLLERGLASLHCRLGRVAAGITLCDRTTPIVQSVLVAIIVLGGLLPAGHFALGNLRDGLEAEHSETRKVVIELKAETLDEVRAVKAAAVEEIRAAQNDTVEAVRAAGAAAVEEIRKLNGEIVMAAAAPTAIPTGTGGADPFSDLKRMVENVRSEQVGIAERLAALQDKPPAPVVMAPPPVAASGLRTTHTVYFPLGAISGPVIDEQVAKLLVPIHERLAETVAEDACRTDVSGFSDTLGNDNANLKLSQDRAEYIAGKLRGKA